MATPVPSPTPLIPDSMKLISVCLFGLLCAPSLAQTIRVPGPGARNGLNMVSRNLLWSFGGVGFHVAALGDIDADGVIDFAATGVTG